MNAAPYRVSDVSAHSPDMDDTDFDAFVEDIRRHGQLVPIWISGEEVIDGRKRLAACARLGIEPVIVRTMPGQDAESISRSLNLLRTHYTPSQRAMFAAKRANATRADAGRLAHKNGNAELRVAGVVTAEEAAREVGVDASRVREAKRVRRDASPVVVRAVEAGKLTLHSAAEISRSVPVEEQPAAVERVVEAAKGKSRNSPASVLQTKPARRPPTRPAAEQIEKSVQAMEVTAGHLVTLLGQPQDWQDWPKRLRAVRTQLTRAIGQMEGGTE
jgi:ParB-like chromosome segregation protein Spo0J